MSRTVSPSSNRPYGVVPVVAAWNLARSSFYAARQRQQQREEPPKRGPKVRSDEELLVEIRQVLAEPVFTGEGYRKIWARLRHLGVRTCKDRVLRLLREHQLLSPARQPEPMRGNPHEGTIVSKAPNQMWGTDATATSTEADGPVTIFAAIDHCTAECTGIHAVKKASRFEALEPIRQGVQEYFGGFAGGSAAGLRLRHDHGSVYMSDELQKGDSLPWHGTLSGIRPPARGKWVHRTLLSHPERTALMDSTVPGPDRTPSRPGGVSPAV
jgi:putative transposase